MDFRPHLIVQGEGLRSKRRLGGSDGNCRGDSAASAGYTESSLEGVALPIRAAHFIQRYPPALGGSEAYFARLGRYLAAGGDCVNVFTTVALSLEAFWSRKGRCHPAGDSREDGVLVRRYRLCRWPARRYQLKALSLFPHRLWQCLTQPCNPISFQMWREAGRPEQEFDLVHASAFPYAWPIACGLRLARRFGVPFVLTPFLHTGDPGNLRDPTRRSYTSAPFRFLLRAADRIFAQTESERAALWQLGIAPEKIVLQGLGVDAGECTGGNRARARARWNVREGEVVIGHLANQSKEKGTIDLVHAVQTLWQSGLPVRLVLAGPEMPSFCRFWRTLTGASGSMDARILRLGVLDDQGKRDFFAGLDVFALPSRSDSFGLVLLESWANGVPNVAYRAGGIADVVRHGQDGVLARCGNIDELAAALASLVRDGDLRRRLGHAGLERIPREFRWEDKLRLVRNVYHELVEKSKDR